MLPEILLYTSLTCEQSAALMLRARMHQHLPEEVKIELVETIKDSAPQCDWYWDAND